MIFAYLLLAISLATAAVLLAVLFTKRRPHGGWFAWVKGTVTAPAAAQSPELDHVTLADLLAEESQPGTGYTTYDELVRR